MMSATPSRWIVLGGGYSGGQIARFAHQRGADVEVTHRAVSRLAERHAEGIRETAYDASAPHEPSWLGRAEAAVVVITFSPREVDDVALARLCNWLADAHVGRVLYVSSTSVLPGNSGEAVHDDTPVDPNERFGEPRLRAERIVRDGDFDSRVLRLPGIYGPGRTRRESFVDRTYVVPGDGSTLTNRIHVDDIASATWVVGSTASSRTTWLACDRAPTPIREYADWMCETLGLEPLPSTAWADVPERSRPFLESNRRCEARALLQEGWQPMYPSFREGLIASWAAEGVSIRPGLC